MTGSHFRNMAMRAIMDGPPRAAKGGFPYPHRSLKQVREDRVNGRKYIARAS